MYIMSTRNGRGPGGSIDWALEPKGGGACLFRISVAAEPRGVEAGSGVEGGPSGRGFRLTAAGLVAEGEAEEFLAFLRAFAEGRRAIYAPSGSDFALYADPRPEGSRLTVECFGEAHATCGVTVTRETAQELVGRLLAGAVPSRPARPRGRRAR